MDKPRLYLLAGNGGAADWWDDALPYFSAYRPLPLDLPGFGDNAESPCENVDAYAESLLAATQRGSAIFAVGVNALLVLHALQRRPGHFSRTVLLAPVGAFLWQRKLPALMSLKPLRRLAHWLLSNRPQWFARKFSKQRWTAAQYRRMGDGYRRCRAFLPFWDMIRADKALALLEWIRDPIELVWGDRDAVLATSHAAAWSAILARADLRVAIRPGWGHYPWIDNAAEFVHWLESGEIGFRAHTKGGRLQLAQLAGLPVPAVITVTSGTDPRLAKFLANDCTASWAVRSSSITEDQADHANAGLSKTFLRQTGNDMKQSVATLLEDGVAEVVVQRFVAPKLSGIAFVRHLSAEIEWVDGHLECLADGRNTPKRVVLSRLGEPWSEGDFLLTEGLTRKRLWQFLQAVLHAFHYVHGDIEWAWDGTRLWLLQYRPIAEYAWRRHLTAANISEILPPQPSRLMEYAQRRAALSIPAVLARWDVRVLEDNEPVTACFGGASYINNDLFLARLSDWGLPAKRYADEVGGSVPDLPWRPLRLLRSLPILWRLQRESRVAMLTLDDELQGLDRELNTLVRANADGQQLADWFTRFYVFAVQSNLYIAAAIASSFGDIWGRPETAYRNLVDAPHRLPWETDPATPRPSTASLPLQSFPRWPTHIRFAHRFGLPGLRGHYLQVREWYRDNLMRIYFRLHHAMPKSDREHWFAPHPHPRARNDSFWQDGREGSEQADGFLIFPGHAQGVLGREILLVETLDPGRYADYRAARAVISRMGGRLSHGATLLRELRKPSAVLPTAELAWLGRNVNYRDGVLTLLVSREV